MQSNNSEKSNSSIFEDSGYLKEEELEEKGEEILFSNEESYFGDTSASQGAFLKKKRKFSKKYRKRMAEKEKSKIKGIKSAFGGSSAPFIKTALENFKSTDEMEILNALTTLCSELSMANDSVGDDLNTPELIRNLVILIDKYPFLPDINLWSLNCINYILDINPRSTNTVVKYNGIPKIVKMAQNVEYIDCVESSIKAIEKMSFENIFGLLEKNAFISVLEFIDFFDLSLRKSALKACVNMAKGGNSLEYVNKHIMPGVQNLTGLTRLNGNTEIEKTIVDLAIQCFYYIVSGTKSYNYSADLGDFCNEIIKFGLLDILFDLFSRFISENNDGDKNNNSDSQMRSFSVNVNAETVKTILKLFSLLCTLSPSITSFLLNSNTLELIYKVLSKELGAAKQTMIKDSKESAKSKLSSSSHSLYSEIFVLLISFFPTKVSGMKKKVDKKIMSKENEAFFLYFSQNILTLLIDNILHIPSSNTTLGVIKLITMYCQNSPVEYIKKYIDSAQLSNSLGKMLDSKDSSYILDVLNLVDIIMEKVPEYFMVSFLRDGVVENISKMVNIDEKSLYITKESTEANLKNLATEASITKIKTKNTNSMIMEVIHGNAKILMTKYFTDANIKKVLDLSKEKNGVNPIEIMSKLNELKEQLKTKKANANTFKELFDILLNKNVTFFEIEKSEVILYLCYFIDENFLSNYSSTYDTDTQTEVTLANKSNPNVIAQMKEVIDALRLLPRTSKDEEVTNIMVFLNLLEQCISSMNCFKLYLYEYENVKNTSNLFLNALSGNSIKLSSRVPLTFTFDPSECEVVVDDVLKEVSSDVLRSSFEFFGLNKTVKISFDSEVKFDNTIKEAVLNYPQRPLKFDEEDCLSELMKYFMKRESGNEDISFNQTGEFFKKIIGRKKLAEQSQENKNSSNPEEESASAPDKEKEKEKEDNAKKEIQKFFDKFDLGFFAKTKTGNKYSVRDGITIGDFLRDAKVHIPRNDFIGFCSDFNLRFFIKKKEIPKAASKEDVKEDESEKFLRKLLISREEIQNGLLSAILFKKYYYKNIINNKSLYNIKRASPFFYLISLLQFCHNEYTSLFIPDSSAEKIPIENFENIKMSTLLLKQVRDPYAVSSKSIPSWCHEVNSSFPFFTNFSSRYLLFKTTAFDNKRSMLNLYIYLRNFLGENIFEDKSISSLATNTVRTKVKINRDEIVEQGYILSNEFPNYKGYIEFEYLNETGTGMGPTLEFYSLFFKGVSLLEGIWYKTEDNSLFPLPREFASDEEKEKIKKIFSSLGYVIARGIYDDRLIDIPLNSLFWHIVLGKPLSINGIEKIDVNLGKFLINLEKLSPTEIDECDLYFTCPWDNSKNLVSDGDKIKLSKSNSEEYIYEIMNKLMIEGQGEVISAFRSGFNKVFDIDELRCFMCCEIQDIICGSNANDDNTWSYENLLQNIIPMHGFTKESMVYKGLIDILMKMSKNERKMFLLFVTGSPRLPIGGFKNLHPKLTVVMFQSEISNGSNDCADNHLPSVMTCQNYLKIPNYSSVEILKKKLFTAIMEGNNAFHLS